jgi:hypothetical protein
MELYVKKNEPVHALQIKFPKAMEGRFSLDTYIESEIEDFFQEHGYFFEVKLYSVSKVIVSCSKEADSVGLITDGVFSFTLNNNDWIVIDESTSTVTAMLDEEFKSKHEPVEPYLEQVQNMVAEERPIYGETKKPTEEWTLLKVVGNEIIEATQITPAIFLLKITNKITNNITFITQDGKAPKN